MFSDENDLSHLMLQCLMSSYGHFRVRRSVKGTDRCNPKVLRIGMYKPMFFARWLGCPLVGN
jgi:hypothetical protein